MKFSILFLALALGLATPVHAEDERIIEYATLPSPAQQLIQKHFKGNAPSITKKDVGILSHNYEVIFVDGTKIEFDRRGRWIDIEARGTAVPSELVPRPIAHYVSKSFPNTKIVTIERNKRGYNVDLSNGIELDFNRKFKLLTVGD